MAALLLVERVHSTLVDFMPSYSDLIRSLNKKIRRKIGAANTLYDKIVLFLGTDDIMEGSFKTDHKIQDGPLWTYMHDTFKPSKVYNVKANSESFDLLQISELEFIPVSSNTESDAASVIIKKFYDRPACVEKVDDTVGVCPFMLTMGHCNDRPFVFQIRQDEDDGEDFTIVDFLFGANDKELFDQLAKKMKAYVREKSPLKNWVISCEDDDMGGVDFFFEEELCKKLRFKKYKFDPNLYNADVRNLIQKDIKNFIAKQDMFCKEGYDGRRAYLLEGPPGTGKSDIIKSIISILPSTYTTIILNDKNIYELRSLKRMKFLFPALVVIEDIDLLVGSRNKWQVLLNFLDGLHSPDRIITIMTSNNKGALISAITSRPGRIDRIVHVGAGDEEQRIAQLKSLTQGIDLPDSVKIEAIAKKTKDYTIAELREIIRRSLIYSNKSTNTIDVNELTTVLTEFERQKIENNTELQQNSFIFDPDEERSSRRRR